MNINESNPLYSCVGKVSAYVKEVDHCPENQLSWSEIYGGFSGAY